MKTLVIAEKPSVGKDIARVLGCKNSKNGFIEGGKYVVTWAMGHLVTLADPEKYDDKYKSWNLSDLPIMPKKAELVVIKQTSKQFGVVKTLIHRKDISEVVIATDAGREGELVARWCLLKAGNKKPLKRLWISSVTDKAIKEGFLKLKNGKEYDNLYYSAVSRAEADWLVGINATRALTSKFNAQLSCGRVQTPTLSIIFKREEDIKNFKPAQYFGFEILHSGIKFTWTEAKSGDIKTFDREKRDFAIQNVKNKKGKIISVEKNVKKAYSPLLYDLTELQRDANKRFGFSAKETLSIMQTLYERHKVLTYPRTDSRYLTEDIVETIPERLSALPKEYFKFKNVLLKTKIKGNSNFVNNKKVSDHHAIIPTDTKINIMALSDAEFKVFDLIVRRFLAVFYPQYIYNTTKIITTVDVHNFITKGTTIIQEGWTVLNIQSRNDKKEEDTLPNVKKGDSVMNEASEAVEKQTVPPKMYNEANLLSAMENAGRFVDDESLKEQLKEGGLGTPATRAAIIERLLQVGYIQRKGKTLIPTEKGMKLIEVVPPELKSPETTGKWEKGLSSISKGKMGDERFMGSIKRYVNYLVEQSKTSIKRVDFPKDERNLKKGGKRITVLGKCPKCENGEILENSKSFYCTNWKRGCKFSLWKNCIENYGKTITAKDAKTLIKERKIINSDITLPQTGEKCAGDIILKDDNSGSVEIVNLQRKREN